jgi:hypothetical protein
MQACHIESGHERFCHPSHFCRVANKKLARLLLLFIRSVICSFNSIGRHQRKKTRYLQHASIYLATARNLSPSWSSSLPPNRPTGFPSASKSAQQAKFHDTFPGNTDLIYAHTGSAPESLTLTGAIRVTPPPSVGRLFPDTNAAIWFSGSSWPPNS